MRTGTVFVIILGLCALLATPAQVTGQQGTRAQEYTLNFIPTQNAPQAALGRMTLNVTNGDTIVHFQGSGSYPNTVFTVGAVFNVLDCPPCGDGIQAPAL